MKRLGTFEGRAIVASEFAPENKYDIWYDATENQYKECIDGQWVKSPNIQAPIEPYELPVASADTLGGVKVGEGLAIAEDGKLSIEGGGTVLIHGEINYEGEDIFSFSPIEGELTLAEAVNLYKSGTSIILVFNAYESINPSDVIYSTVKYLAQSREANDARFKGDYWVDYYINRNIIWEGLI